MTLQQGFNLVGNPFPRAAYIDKPYYTLNENGSAVPTTSAKSTATAISPCYGVVVQGTSNNETLTFTTTAPVASGSTNQGHLQIALNQATEPVDPSLRGTKQSSTIDNAIVSFNEGEQLGKFYFGSQNANIYLPQDGKEYAIAYSDKQGEMPFNFKAMKNGTYTISVNPEGVEMSYLHLIDNMTGADVDLLATNGGDARPCVSTYTFTAKTTDYASRFSLVFACGDDNGNNGGDNDNFAFFSNGNLIVNGTGTLQVIDILGREVAQKELSTFNSQLSTLNYAPGIYVLRLINSNDVKTQKVVIE